MFYIYRAQPSDSARSLARALGGYKVSIFSKRKKRKPNDVVVCWGEADPEIPGIGKVLNGTPIRNKYWDAVALKDAGVPTVEVGLRRPAGELWLPRKANHIGGTDLLAVGDDLRHAVGDYYSKYVEVHEEYRIHCFHGKSLRAGKKVHRTLPDGKQPHGWIRSWDAGWKVSYDAFQSTKKMRALAASACTALKLDFGAVDIAKVGRGAFIVLEVNRAPGLEGNSIAAYANAIQMWSEGRQIGREEGDPHEART